MNNIKSRLKEILFAVIILATAFAVNMLIKKIFSIDSLIPMIFVLGIFLISLRTNGYVIGIVSSVVSVFAVNYAFTFPYYAFDLISPECVVSVIVMLIIAIMTSTLTTQIKEQQKTRAESEKEKMRANLLRGISHDLRTPLTSICGSTSAIIENYDMLDKEQQIKLLSEIREDSKWLNRMVENLLSVTRINSEKVRVIKTPTVLEELIDAVILKFHKHCPDQDVKVTIPEEFISIPMDALLIEQVIINILENAVFHAKGLTEIHLNVTTKDNLAVFEISDNGCGIPKDRLEHLFSGYLERMDVSADSSRNNMGIGLSVCASIIKAHGSVISAENLKNGGALFRFALEMEE
ncbi:MAG: DUF4118 domain-containing protein [Oscillospiraceae bacterium]|nr:DUF4118 domain-containing protein [Oscillospiraceae bacterium]